MQVLLSTCAPEQSGSTLTRSISYPTPCSCIMPTSARDLQAESALNCGTQWYTVVHTETGKLPSDFVKVRMMYSGRIMKNLLSQTPEIFLKILEPKCISPRSIFVQCFNVLVRFSLSRSFLCVCALLCMCFSFHSNRASVWTFEGGIKLFIPKSWMLVFTKTNKGAVNDTKSVVWIRTNLGGLWGTATWCRLECFCYQRIKPSSHEPQVIFCVYHACSQNTSCNDLTAKNPFPEGNVGTSVLQHEKISIFFFIWN